MDAILDGVERVRAFALEPQPDGTCDLVLHHGPGEYLAVPFADEMHARAGLLDLIGVLQPA